MRRRDREMPKEFALEIIDKCGYAVLSMIDQDAPYAVPISVARDGDTVYFHCAKEGRKTDILRSYPRVCLVFVGDVRPAFDKFTVRSTISRTMASATPMVEMTGAFFAMRCLC